MTKVFKPQQPVAWFLFYSLVDNYKTALNNVFKNITPKQRAESFNWITTSTLSGYTLAINIWEAYLNENFFSSYNFINPPHPLILEMEEHLDRWPLEAKTYFLPKMTLGKTFDKSRQPFQDFNFLITIRNHIVHHKMHKSPDKIISELLQRKIAYSEPNRKLPWEMELGSTECFRWLIEVLIWMVEEFASFFSEEKQPISTSYFREYYEQEIGPFLKEYKKTPIYKK